MSSGVLFRGPQRMQSKVRDLQHKSRVHHAVAGLQVTVGSDIGTVEVMHTLWNIQYQKNQLRKCRSKSCPKIQYNYSRSLKPIQ